MKWTEPHQLEWLREAKANVRQFWEDKYCYADLQYPNTIHSDIPSIPPKPLPIHTLQDDLDAFMCPPDFYNPTTSATRNKYKEYINIPPTYIENPLKWWGERRDQYPHLSKMAFDLLSIPLMAAECERVFSQAKRFIPDDRSKLKEDIIEAMVVLKGLYEVEGND
jgi:hypothetical protein